MQAQVHKTAAASARIDREGSPYRTLRDPSGQIVRLGREEHLKLTAPRGWTVRALAGTAWVTQDGDIRDIVLKAGQEYVFDRNADALVSAFGDVRVCIAPQGTVSAAQPCGARAVPGRLPAARPVAA